MTAKTIAITNQKGGSSKTCTAMCLAGELGTRGYRVLVVTQMHSKPRCPGHAPPQTRANFQLQS